MSVLTRPDTVVYTITNGTIAWNTEGGTVGAHPGGKVHFSIDNNHDDVGYDVSIPFDKFKLKWPADKDEPKRPAPEYPIDEAASGGKNTVNVPPHSTRELRYVIKPRAYFPFEKDKVDAYIYKYTLNYTNTQTNETKPADPDLEVTP